jgi:hypothetical protein
VAAQSLLQVEWGTTGGTDRRFFRPNEISSYRRTPHTLLPPTVSPPASQGCAGPALSNSALGVDLVCIEPGSTPFVPGSGSSTDVDDKVWRLVNGCALTAPRSSSRRLSTSSYSPTARWWTSSRCRQVPAPPRSNPVVFAGTEVEFLIPYNDTSAATDCKDEEVKCEFFDRSASPDAWSSRGCELLETRATLASRPGLEFARCRCTHLTGSSRVVCSSRSRFPSPPRLPC